MNPLIKRMRTDYLIRAAECAVYQNIQPKLGYYRTLLLFYDFSAAIPNNEEG